MAAMDKHFKEKENAAPRVDQVVLNAWHRMANGCT